MNHKYRWQFTLGKFHLRYWQGSGRKLYLQRMVEDWLWLELGVARARFSLEWL